MLKAWNGGEGVPIFYCMPYDMEQISVLLSVLQYKLYILSFESLFDNWTLIRKSKWLVVSAPFY